MLDTITGEVEKTTLEHEGKRVRQSYSTLPRGSRLIRCGCEVIATLPQALGKTRFEKAALATNALCLRMGERSEP